MLTLLWSFSFLNPEYRKTCRQGGSSNSHSVQAVSSLHTPVPIWTPDKCGPSIWAGL